MSYIKICQKNDLKQSIMCNMSNVKNSNTLTMDEVHKKIKLTKGGSNIKRSILRSHMKVILILENIFL